MSLSAPCVGVGMSRVAETSSEARQEYALWNATTDQLQVFAMFTLTKDFTGVFGPAKCWFVSAHVALREGGGFTEAFGRMVALVEAVAGADGCPVWRVEKARHHTYGTVGILRRRGPIELEPHHFGCYEVAGLAQACGGDVGGVARGRGDQGSTECRPTKDEAPVYEAPGLTGAKEECGEV